MRVLPIFENFLQPHRVEKHGIVQVSGVRTNLEKQKNQKGIKLFAPVIFFPPENTWGTNLSFRCQVALERVSLQSLKNLLKEVIVLIAFIGFLANDKGHVKCSRCLLVDGVQGSFPQVVLHQKNKTHNFKGSSNSLHGSDGRERLMQINTS